MWQRGEGENNREAEKGDKWRRKGARPRRASGRFQLVMETGVAHPAAVVTDLTCPPDIHLQSSLSSALHSLYSLLPSLSIYLNPHSFILTCFYILILLPKHSFNPLFCLSLLYFLFFPSFLSPSCHFRSGTAELWQLFTFHFSPPQRGNGRASGALLKQTGGRVVRQGWRHAITNHRLLAVAGRWCIGPGYGSKWRAKQDLPFWFPWQSNSNISRGEVRSDGRWELTYWTTWSDGLTCTRWNHNRKNVQGNVYSGLKHNVQGKYSTNEEQNKKCDKRRRNSVMMGCEERCVRFKQPLVMVWIRTCQSLSQVKYFSCINIQFITKYFIRHRLRVCWFRGIICVCVRGGEYCVRAVAELSLRERPLLLNSFKELDSREGNAWDVINSVVTVRPY